MAHMARKSEALFRNSCSCYSVKHSLLFHASRCRSRATWSKKLTNKIKYKVESGAALQRCDSRARRGWCWWLLIGDVGVDSLILDLESILRRLADNGVWRCCVLRTCCARPSLPAFHYITYNIIIYVYIIL